jgi:hypothetical protein
MVFDCSRRWIIAGPGTSRSTGPSPTDRADQAGIDPLIKLIDRNPDDNLTKVEKR